MPTTAKRVIEIVKEEVSQSPNRIAEYQETLLDAVVDILEAEHKNRIQSTQIQRIVTDACCAAGAVLARRAEPLPKERDRQ
jgi:hypothetical protein